MLHLKDKYIVYKFNKVNVYNNQRYTLKNSVRFLDYVITTAHGCS